MAACTAPLLGAVLALLLAVASVFLFPATSLSSYAVEAPQGGAKRPPTAAALQDIAEVCGGSEGTVSLAQPYELPDVVAVNWGQADGPYALPAERLVVCADMRAYLWTKGVGGGLSIAARQLEDQDVEQLFNTILAAWPRGAVARGAEDGNFLWVLDADYNLIISPSVQERADTTGLRDVKHGDLCPGIDFVGHNGVAGPFRGVARMGGEFNLAGSRDGAEWIMHTKSGYCGSRVPLDKATRYYNQMRDAGQSLSEIGRNFEKCVMKVIFLARKPLRSVFCYMRKQLGVQGVPGYTRRCDITDRTISVPGHGGLPNISKCNPRESADVPICGKDDGALGLPIVHLVHWVALGQADPCNESVRDFDVAFEEIGRVFHALPDPASLTRIKNKTKYLRKHVCLTDKHFMRHLRCNIHGCFGEGFTQRLKAVEDSLEDVQLARRMWDGAMSMWRQCRQG